VTVPAGLLASGETYVVVIGASTNANPSAPRRAVVPQSTSNVVSNPFRAP